jgi:hypothetical protein
MRLFRKHRLVGALVVVNSKDGSGGLRGIVRSIDREFVTLTKVEVQNGNATIESACQRTLVPAANVSWIGVEAEAAQ